MSAFAQYVPNPGDMVLGELWFDEFGVYDHNESMLFPRAAEGKVGLMFRAGAGPILPWTGGGTIEISPFMVEMLESADASALVDEMPISDVAKTGEYADLLDKPALFSGAYADLSGKPLLFSGAYADLTGKPVLFDGTWASLSGKPTTFAPSAHNQAWSTITSTPTTLSGYGITDGFTVANARGAVSLTTTGSGAASYNSSTGVLNIPTPSGQSVTNGVSKTLVTSATGQGGVVLDASRNVMVNYSVNTSTTATIGGASSVTVYLEVAATNSATAGDWTTIATVSNGQTITLAVALQSVQTSILNFGAVVEAGKFVRLRYATTGTASCSYLNGQETKL